MTHRGASPAAAMAGVAAPIHPFDALGARGPGAGFINLSNARRTFGSGVVHRVDEAFQAFAYHVLHVPITIQGVPGTLGGNSGQGGGNAGGGSSSGGSQGDGTPGQVTGPVGGIPVGIVPTPPTLGNFLILLDLQTTRALSTIEVDTRYAAPSVAKGPKVSPIAPLALIPFAQQQIIGLGAALAASPPTFHADGSLAGAGSLAGVNAAYDAILDAVAETAVHPQLFASPADFYNNPDTHFTLGTEGDPVAASGYFYRLGPGGVSLRGTE